MHSLVFMLGAAYTLKADEHVRVDIFYRGMSERRKAVVDLAGTLLFLLPLCAFLVVESWQYVATSWRIARALARGRRAADALPAEDRHPGDGRAAGAAGHLDGAARLPAAARRELTMEWLALVLFALIIAALLAGYPVAFTLAGVSLGFAAICSLFGAFDMAYLEALPSRLFGAMMNQTLVAVPLFVFMGLVLERARIAESLLETLGQLFGTAAAASRSRWSWSARCSPPAPASSARRS